MTCDMFGLMSRWGNESHGGRLLAATEWLLDRLDGMGPVESAVVKMDAIGAGHSLVTLSRALTELTKAGQVEVVLRGRETLWNRKDGS